MIEYLKEFGINPAIVAFVIGVSAMLPQIIKYVEISKRFIATLLIKEVAISDAFSPSLMTITFKYLLQSKDCKIFL